MLHLIWTKDNSGTTSEEDKELKGIRQRLIECYRALYFDPIDDTDSRQQTNRIAKNMIEFVTCSLERTCRFGYSLDDHYIASLVMLL